LKLIKLNHTQYGVILINPDHISGIMVGDAQRGSSILINNRPSAVQVHELPEQIFNLIKEAEEI
jgi:hypothetical protein